MLSILAAENRMSGCALRRWGSGTNCTRPADTPAAKEMAARLAAMQAERQRQDTSLWGSGATGQEGEKPQEISRKEDALATRTQRTHLR